MLDDTPKKTWKREVAVLLILYLAGLSVYDLLAAGPTRAMSWAELFSIPIFVFVAGAFGIDAAIKQGGWRLGRGRGEGDGGER